MSRLLMAMSSIKQREILVHGRRSGSVFGVVIFVRSTELVSQVRACMSETCVAVPSRVGASRVHRVRPYRAGLSVVCEEDVMSFLMS